MKRALFTTWQAWHYRKTLSKLKKQGCPSITHINCQQLKAHGITDLILDFDGVMASHGELTPQKDVLEWLNQALVIFGLNHIFILSNKPMTEREVYFKDHYNGIQFMKGVRKKPYPDGLNTIINITQQPPSHHVLVDDRLLTGMLASTIAGTQGIFITHPYTQFDKRPIQEFFFTILRAFEKWIF